MTPTEAQKAFSALRVEIARDALLSVRMNFRDFMPVFTCTVYVSGILNGATFSVDADTLGDLVADTTAAWVTHCSRHRAERTRKMALAIIDITGTHGECPATHLRMAGFTDAEISDLGAYAVTEADTLSERRPFSIGATAKANAA